MPLRFKTFDAFRFISFMLVFLHHLPLSEKSFFRIFSNSGSIGVSFFFVLSGFLITYLLLEEKIANGNIAPARFFARRILRTWPLYFAMVLFAATAGGMVEYLGLNVSTEGYTPRWLMTCLFLENYQMMISGQLPNISPLSVMWTVCVEEHFYLVWGITLYFIPVARLRHVVVIAILLANITRIIYSRYGIPSLDLFSNFDYFAWGAFPAILLVGKSGLLVKLKSTPPSWRNLFLAVIVILVFGWPDFSPVWLDLLGPSVFGVLFALLILSTLPGIDLVQIPETTIISRLGKYTYGLYLIHTVVISALIQVAKRSGLPEGGFIFALTAFILTLGAAMVSFHAFEKRFLKLKEFYRQPVTVPPHP